jgi:hypothetical protein
MDPITSALVAATVGPPRPARPAPAAAPLAPLPELMAWITGPPAPLPRRVVTPAAALEPEPLPLPLA